MALSLGLALDAQIRPVSRFYRKQYFYPDLPKGYQITQGPVALVEEGRLEIPGDPAVRGAQGPLFVRIERAHLEEDAGKSHHDMGPDVTHVDLNRAGVPLLEIVGAPDLRSPQEASDYLKILHRLVMGLDICDGNMEEGSFRCDANVSVRRTGDPAFGTRVEVKNLNSFRFVRQALAYEVGRHIGCLERGEPLVQETRGWDAATCETRSQRSKETAMDYRTFPEPDLPALVVEPAEVEAARAALPDLPQAKIQRWRDELGLGEEEAQALLQSRAFTAYFEALSRACRVPRAAAKWMLGEVSRTLNEQNLAIEAYPLQPEALAELIRLVEDRVISFGAAREQIYPLLLGGQERAEALVARLGLAQVDDRSAIEALVLQVLAANPGPVDQHRSGSKNLTGFLTGQILKAGGGKLDPKVVQEVLAQALAKPR
jgi:aspartyl-tRNA(Asn)/glutamyl-tRNA(Gln) amidotransferase subunit B